MTKNKRFYCFGDGEDINSGVIDGDTELTLEETVGIMNELHEEREQLKQQLSQAKVNHKSTQKISLLEENRLLRKAAENLETDYLEELKE